MKQAIPKTHYLLLLLASFLFSCKPDYYTIEDYSKVKKIDAHVHIENYDPSLLKQAETDNFRLLTINTESKGMDDVYDQQDVSLYLHDHHPLKINSLTTFSVENWGTKHWSERWLNYIKKTIDEGALGVKVWKNIGMVLRAADSSYVMIDDTSFAKIFKYLEKNDIPLMAHIGEPKNCWLPLDEMTVDGEKSYFSRHPEYHMYLHPEAPSYEEQIESRDNLLKKYPKLKIIGAHLGSLEWDVDVLAKTLDQYPNFAVDLSGRIQHLQYQSLTDYDKVRDFVIKYQDRLLYGTDLTARKDEDKEDAMSYAHKIWFHDWQYFATDDSMTHKRHFKEAFKGLKLPKNVIDNIYFNNAVKWFNYPVKEKEIKNSDTYTNPVGGYIRMGDPFVMKYEGKYYLYGTTGRDGFKCWSSDNLRDWTYESYAFKETEESWGDNTYWAPEVIHYNDKFYMTYSCKPKDKSKNLMLVCLAESDSPTGPFVDKYAPWIDMGFSCIDADIFVDGDGTPYTYFDRVGSVGQWPNNYLFGIIYGMKLDKETLKPIGDTVRIVHAEQEWESPNSMLSRCNEGAFVFKKNNKYYITFSAGHWADSKYAIGYATADSPLGVWTKADNNPLVIKDSLKGVFGPGHSSITTSPDDSEMILVYHAHISNENKQRTVNIDRLEIDSEGKLKIIGPTRTPQPLPSNN